MQQVVFYIRSGARDAAQRVACHTFAEANALQLAAEFSDPDREASGSDSHAVIIGNAPNAHGATGAEVPIAERAGFAEMLKYCADQDVRRVVFCDLADLSANRAEVETMARQLERMGMTLVAAQAPEHFVQSAVDPEIELIRRTLQANDACSAVAEEYHRAVVAQRKTTRSEVENEARRLYEDMLPNGKRRSLRKIAAELAKSGYLSPTGKHFHANQISRWVSD